MPASHDTYTRQQGQRETYDIEYTPLRYKISLHGRMLKNVQLPLERVSGKAADATWQAAVADIEHLRGMPEH